MTDELPQGAISSEALSDYMPMVYAEARRLSYTLPSAAVEIEELAGFGFIGLLEAAKRFDPDRQVPFGAFARFRVRGAMIDGLRGVLGLTRRRAYERFRQQVIAEKVGPVRDADRNAHEAAEATCAEIMQLASVYLQARVDSPDNCQLLVEKEERQRLAIALSQLDGQERSVIDAVYDMAESGDSGAALAKRMGIHRSGVSRRHKAALSKLRSLFLSKKDEPS